MSDKPFVPYYLRNDLKHNRNSKKSETPQNRRRKSVSEIIKNFQKNGSTSSEGSGQNFTQSIARKKSEPDFSPSPNFIQKRTLSFNSDSNSSPTPQLSIPNEPTMPPNYFISVNDHVYSPKIQETMTEFDSLNLSSPRSSKSSGLIYFFEKKRFKTFFWFWKRVKFFWFKFIDTKRNRKKNHKFYFTNNSHESVEESNFNYKISKFI
jgi:hypothetical protein